MNKGELDKCIIGTMGTMEKKSDEEAQNKTNATAFQNTLPVHN